MYIVSRLCRLLSLALLIIIPTASRADNPIIQTSFTADPAPLVYNGTVYLYTSHDEDDARDFKMRDWRLYTSTDMVNWTDHGAVASLATFSWANQDNDAWAPQVVVRDGRFYLYAPVTVPGKPKNVIAVAVADTPFGPFKDALGHPLIDRGEGYFDPTVIIDNDGQAYLYWGNPDLWHVRLNRNMISYSGGITSTPRLTDYQEGPWSYKRQNHYYMAFASTCCPEGIGYAMSDHATGPWQYEGAIMDHDKRSSGNHPGIIDYKGRSYVFGFNYRLNFAEGSEHRERRSVTLAELHYKTDGTIPTLPWWNRRGVSQVGALDPFRRVEAETIAWTSALDTSGSGAYDWAPGVRTARNAATGMYVTGIRNATYIKVRGVDFGKTGASGFNASLATPAAGGRIDLHLDSPTGPKLGSLTAASTGGWDRWRIESIPLLSVGGVHDLVMVFVGPPSRDLFNMDYWFFNRSTVGKLRSWKRSSS